MRKQMLSSNPQPAPPHVPASSSSSAAATTTTAAPVVSDEELACWPYCYQVDLLKDDLEDLEESHWRLQRDLKEKTRVSHLCLPPSIVNVIASCICLLSHAVPFHGNHDSVICLCNQAECMCLQARESASAAAATAAAAVPDPESWFAFLVDSAHSSAPAHDALLASLSLTHELHLCLR